MSEKQRNTLRLALFLLSFAFLSLGIQENQHQLTMAKAIRICLECIGIG